MLVLHGASLLVQDIARGIEVLALYGTVYLESNAKTRLPREQTRPFNNSTTSGTHKSTGTIQSSEP